MAYTTGEFVYLIWHPIFIQHVGKELHELVVTIAMCMWYTRNKTRHGATRQSSREIILKARSILENYKLAQLRKPQHKELADTQWIPPDYLWYKINTDAAVFSVTKSVGIGVVVRDHEGLVLAALSKCMPLPLGPLEAEAKAMDEAVSFARDIGLQDVIFETDSTTILGALTDTFTTPACITACKVFEEHGMLADMETGQHILWHIMPKELIILLLGSKKLYRVLNLLYFRMLYLYFSSKKKKKRSNESISYFR